ncbi:MAG: histidine phosphatase family protein [Vallitalea sp.]|jgi:broad specificity phosphatase PhoE|nr:histidine phosphatase family protein [Vallitalea sp.]
MKFILLRHGETKANVDKIIYGITHSEFTENGLSQVDYMVDYLKHKKVDYIYSSPLKRTLHIANIVGRTLNTEINVVDDVAEMNYGIFEGLTSDEVKKQYPSEFNCFMNDSCYVIPEGEGSLDFDNRVIKFIDTIKNEEGTSVIVTHGGVIRTTIIHLLNLKSEDRWHFKILPGMVIEIMYENNYGSLLEMKQF